MPTLSIFYGILVMMFFGDDNQHHSPHIHVHYQGKEASISIESGKILAGKFPRKQLKLVQAWIEIHKDDLMLDWYLASRGEPIFKIAPLQ